MIRKYIADIVIMFLISVSVILFAGKPRINFNPPPAAAVKSDKKAVAEIKNEAQVVDGSVTSYDSLEKRNIFTEAGTYAAAGAAALPVLPPNPYALIAILQGNDKKAVFREYTGAIVTVPVGKKMIDEYTVKSIEGLTVKLQKGNEEKKFTIFNSANSLAAANLDDLKKITANPYKLIGILKGKEKKAVIKDYSNSVFILATGEKLSDGSVITGIGERAVTLKKGKENIELKIFVNRVP